MASMYDLDEFVQLVALHLGDYSNLGRIYQLWTSLPYYVLHIYVYLGAWKKSVSNVVVQGFLVCWHLASCNHSSD